jgi:hypothetical protein
MKSSAATLETRFGLLASTEDRNATDRRTLADFSVLNRIPFSAEQE